MNITVDDVRTLRQQQRHTQGLYVTSIQQLHAHIRTCPGRPSRRAPRHTTRTPRSSPPHAHEKLRTSASASSKGRILTPKHHSKSPRGRRGRPVGVSACDARAAAWHVASRANGCLSWRHLIIGNTANSIVCVLVHHNEKPRRFRSDLHAHNHRQ